jgi:hypothetical protein
MSAPVTSLISESTLPLLPLKKATKSDETRSLAVTGLPSLQPDRFPFPMTPSIILQNTRTTAFCAGEYADSRFYKISSQPQINDKDDIWDCECVHEFVIQKEFFKKKTNVEYFYKNYSTSVRINGRASTNYNSTTNLPCRDGDNTVTGLS